VGVAVLIWVRDRLSDRIRRDCLKPAHRWRGGDRFSLVRAKRWGGRFLLLSVRGNCLRRRGLLIVSALVHYLPFLALEAGLMRYSRREAV
jgi:hypothetical protein